MKKRMMTASLLLLCAFAQAAAQSPNVTPPPIHPPLTPRTPPPKPLPSEPTPASLEAKKKYEAMLEKAKKGEGEVDYRALRFTFFETPEFNPLSGMLVYRPLWGALAQSNWPEAVKQAEAVLSKTYVDVNAHMVAYVAHRQQGDEEKAKYHHRWAEGLLASIKAGGDGKTTGTAWHVISTSEEYALFRSMNLNPVGQALKHENGHSYDEITVVDPRTREQTRYYFNIDKPFSAYARK
ncbi:MAG: DUF4919 domain-containing protein [Acidobacteria bacterium]|nr:DUF4919 domain-containing protein [Acidobacteriota bacterium]